MITTVSIAELLEHGVTIQPHEAVAIAQAVAAPGGEVQRTARPPFGPPAPENVHLAPDGSVACMASDGAPAVSEIAMFLQAMLASAVKIPGALRYTIARALLEVDAPPFDSVADFSRTLGRFEGGDRRAVVQNLLQRHAIASGAGSDPSPDSSSQTPPIAPKVTMHLPANPPALLPRVRLAPADRRRIASQVTELRRHLREADQRLYEQQLAGRKTARIVGMPPRSVVAAPPTRAIPMTLFIGATESTTGIPESGAIVPLPAMAGLATGRAGAPVDRTSWLRGLATAVGVATVLVMAAASGFTYVRHRTPPTPAPQATAFTDSDGGPPEEASASGGSAASNASDVPGGERSQPPDESLVRSASPNAALPTRAAVVPPPGAVTGPAGNRAAITDTRAGPPVEEDHAADAIVSALDLQRRPVFSPAFASKESAIFFHTGRDGDARSALAMATPADSAGDLRVITILDDGARNYHVHPSPDGQLIAFDSDRDGERGVYIAKHDGTDVRRVSGSGYAAVPSWAPDGQRLAYVRAEPNNPKVWNLWLLLLDRGKADDVIEAPARRLTHYRYGQPWAASWFSDGRRICYTHEDKIIVLDLLSGRSRTFESPVKGRPVRTPAVSPDGSKIIFQVFRHGALLLDLEKGSMRCVLTDPSAEEFAWAPDGRRVAFHSRRDGQWGIYVYGEN
jgi:hypothetical protein